MENIKKAGIDNGQAAKEQSLSIQEAKDLILSKMRNKQEKFTLPISVLRNYGKIAPITFRQEKYALSKKRKFVVLYGINAPETDPKKKKIETESSPPKNATLSSKK